jgi:hypothetical protein
MRLFRRIGDIIAANLNELVDRFEDPEVRCGPSRPRPDANSPASRAGARSSKPGERCGLAKLRDAMVPREGRT